MYVDNFLAPLHGTYSAATNTYTGANAFATNANIASTNQIDLASGGVPTNQTRDMGAGVDAPKMHVAVTTAFTGGTSAEFQIVAADDAAISTNVTVVGTSGPIPVATLVIGFRQMVLMNPRLLSRGQRYLAMRTVNVGANTTGAIVALFGIDIQDFKPYQSGFAIL